MNRTYEAFAVLTISVTGIFVAARMGLDERPTHHRNAPHSARTAAAQKASADQPGARSTRAAVVRQERLPTLDAATSRQLACCTAGRPDYASGCGADRSTGERYAEPAFIRPQVLPLALPLVRLREASAAAPLEATGYDAAYDLALGVRDAESGEAFQQFGPAARRQTSRLGVAETQRLHEQASNWRDRVWANVGGLISSRPALDRHPLEWLADWLPAAEGEVQLDGLSPVELSATLRGDSRRSAERKPPRPAAETSIRRLPTAPAGR